MSHVMYYYFCAFAPYGCWIKTKALGGILQVPDGRDTGVVNNDVCLTLKKEVRFRGWTDIVDCDTSTTSGLVVCDAWEDTNWLYRPSVGETASACYKKWLV